MKVWTSFRSSVFHKLCKDGTFFAECEATNLGEGRGGEGARTTTSTVPQAVVHLLHGSGFIRLADMSITRNHVVSLKKLAKVLRNLRRRVDESVLHSGLRTIPYH